MAGDHLQRLGDVLAELGQPALAARALGRAGDHHALARQMRRQRPTYRLAAEGATRGKSLLVGFKRRLVLRRRSFQLFKLEFQLVQQLAATLGRGAETVVLELGDQQLEMRHHRLGARRARLRLTPRQLLGRRGCTQQGDVIRDRIGGRYHTGD